MARASEDLRLAVLAALVTGMCFLLAWPFASLGFNDDWSYAYSTLQYAQTARVGYTWASALTLFQVPYGGLLIRWFGFSFDLLRLATLPFSLGCAVLLYLLFRSFRLEGRDALLGTLTLTTSPLFTPLSASFMTDVYGLFFTLACLYGGVRALLSDRGVRAAVWLAAATAAGFTGGANRQIVWAAPIAVLLAFLWEKRRQRALAVLGAGLLAALLAGILLAMHWFWMQPNAIHENPDPVQLARSLGNPYLISRLVFSTALFLLPALLYRLPAWKSLPAWYYLVSVGACAAYYGRPGESFTSRLAPWMSNIVMPQGVLGPGHDLVGNKPVVLGLPVRAALTLAVFGVLAIWFFPIAARIRDRLRMRGTGFPAAPNLPLFLFFAGALVLSLNRPGGVFIDRYLLLLLPMVLLPVLRTRPRAEARLAPVAGWAALALFAVYGVAATHDYYATSRARVRAAALLESAGVPRQHICAGFEFDGWTQLLFTGYIREPTAQPPAGTFPDPRPNWMRAPFWFLAHTPSIEPRYIVSYSPGGDSAAAHFPPVPYTTWLPPFRRRLWIVSPHP